MPSGRTHDRITLWTLPVTAIAALLLSRSGTITLIVCAGFLFGGLMLGPDLDTHSVHYKRWGWLRWIWLPYRGSVRHRSPLSHAPITGTVLRVAYLLLWVGLVSFVGVAIANEIGQLGLTWSEFVERVRNGLQHHQAEWIALLIGLELGALSHYTADWTVSSYKRVKTKGWKALLPKPAKRRSAGRPPKPRSPNAPKRRKGSKKSSMPR
ncbi:metal-binding protein [Oculatella sp. LEGE 06141]|uniref:metal-binding protein n=1 Tax=Oculatella sp. LEGE 06141 TaxID=1828648 RepID=UPI00187E2E31|nr:metal-binding protein [Oculatella sp. LEGE 06141]MBE9177218.1 metal-binding protein [Oculatella sp. LEGE 06141]